MPFQNTNAFDHLTRANLTLGDYRGIIDKIVLIKAQMERRARSAANDCALRETDGVVEASLVDAAIVSFVPDFFGDDRRVGATKSFPGGVHDFQDVHGDDWACVRVD